MILFFRCFFLSINSLHKIFVVFIIYNESCRHWVLCNGKFIFFNGVIYIIIYYYNVQVSCICKFNKNYPRDKNKYSIVVIMSNTIIIYYILHLPKLKKQKTIMSHVLLKIKKRTMDIYLYYVIVSLSFISDKYITPYNNN